MVVGVRDADIVDDEESCHVIDCRRLLESARRPFDDHAEGRRGLQLGHIRRHGDGIAGTRERIARLDVQNRSARRGVIRRLVGGIAEHCEER